MTALNNGSFTEKQLAAVPYVAYKVTAAEDGTYRVKVGYVIGEVDTSKRAAHRMLLYVNGQVYEAPYTNSSKLGSGAHSESTAEIPLQKGENTIYCIPFDKEYRTANTLVWVNMDYLDLVGKVSARQEAESQSDKNHAGNADTTWKDKTSGGAVMGFGSYKNADLPTCEELNNGSFTQLDMKNVPYIAYHVKVSAKGTYRMKVGYMIYGNAEANWPNHNVLVYVNGQAYRAPYTSTTSWKPYSESEIEVSLKAGENIVYCIPFEKGYKETDGNADASDIRSER